MMKLPAIATIVSFIAAIPVVFGLEMLFSNGVSSNLTEESSNARTSSTSGYVFESELRDLLKKKHEPNVCHIDDHEHSLSIEKVGNVFSG